MNADSEIIKKSRGEILRQRNSFKINSLNFTIPRKFKFSGHFNLNTNNFFGGVLMVTARN